MRSNWSVRHGPVLVGAFTVSCCGHGSSFSAFQKAGITFQTDSCLPNLVSLSEDPQLSEVLLYAIAEGTTTVGRGSPSSSPDIRLSGVLVADSHW